MRGLSLAAAALFLVAGCDSYGVDGICLIGDQPALRDNTVDAVLLSPASGDTLRLGEPFRLRGRVEAVGPDIQEVDVRLQVLRIRRFESPFHADTLLDEPIARRSRAATLDIDREFTIGRLRGGVVSADLDADEDLYVTLPSSIRFPVESEGPGCSTTLSGSGATPLSQVTLLNARPTD